MHIVLLQTSEPHERGSMSAYGGLVLQALDALHAPDVQIELASLIKTNGRSSMWRQHLWRFQHAEKILGVYPCDTLFHLLDGSMTGTLPRQLLPRLLVTLHDFIPLRQMRGEWPGKPPSWPARLLVRRSLNMLAGCRSLCAVSHCTADDSKRFTGRPVDAVIPLALRGLTVREGSAGGMNREAPRSSGLNVAGNFQLPRRFIFHVGHNASYKNRVGVLEVFRNLRDVQDVELVMAGVPPDAALCEMAQGLPGVHFLSDVDDELLATLYARAEMLLFPSFFEGFGMPVLEAMAAGCPVICSNAGALPEVAGDAALMAPADPAAMATACRRVLFNETLRNDLIVKGRIRAGQFTSKRMGEQLLKWYRHSATISAPPIFGFGQP